MTDRAHPLNAQTVASLLADTTPYLSCDDCFARLDEHVERSLNDPHYTDRALQAHLSGCPACAGEAATLRELVESHAD